MITLDDIKNKALEFKNLGGMENENILDTVYSDLVDLVDAFHCHESALNTVCSLVPDFDY
jgi:hypothetical protein